MNHGGRQGGDGSSRVFPLCSFQKRLRHEQRQKAGEPEEGEVSLLV